MKNGSGRRDGGARAGADGPRTAEDLRLDEDCRREKNWKRWGPYLSERQWGTVREDYSEWGSCWDYFPHDQARSRAYRWGEDGILGITDRQCRLCFALAMWNEKDPILKERLFGLTGPEGNHGEDVKEAYFYLDSTPTHSYMKGLYKYPQSEFPYRRLVEENRRRGKEDPELEIHDTGAFDEGRYFDVFVEYAKADTDDILIRITVANRGPEKAVLHMLPTFWFRNNWSWGCRHEGCEIKPRMALQGDTVLARQATLGSWRFAADRHASGMPRWIFTDNETNTKKLFGVEPPTPYVKDAFHEYLVHGRGEAVNPDEFGTKAAAWYRLEVPAGGQVVLRLRMHPDSQAPAEYFGEAFDSIFVERIREADAFYSIRLPEAADREEARVIRQGYAGLLWTKQF
ncbi:MAG TPA: glucosidase, partial [Candidatus Polarisedimenticolia bacterium]|nr:glucosidase [Candidatus Polarisedimenticolia bacterium]